MWRAKKESRVSATGKKLVSVFLSMLIVLTSVLGTFPPQTASAANATKDNAVIFTVKGTINAGVVTYHITVDEIFDQQYQSFTITYPKELEIEIPSALDSIWNISESGSADSKVKSAGFIIKSGTRSAALLGGDLESISFTLSDADVFPPNGSKVTISASTAKETMFVDDEGYVHYYQFVPWTQSPTGNFYNWVLAYDDAKSDARMRQDPRYPDDPSKKLQGYLATITSQKEQDQVYTQIATNCGWLGGTRMLLRKSAENVEASGDPILDQKSLAALSAPYTSYVAGAYNDSFVTNSNSSTAQTSYWYWATGPEAGQVFYMKPTRNTAGTGAPGSGTNTLVQDETLVKASNPLFTGVVGYEYFAGGEPNNSDSTTRDGNLGGEYVLQFAWSNAPTWNDYSHANGGSIDGYYIEWGGYEGDPTYDQLRGSTVESSSDVDLVLPIVVQYRSTVQSGSDADGNPIYRQITGIGTAYDRMENYDNHWPYTALRINDGEPAIPASIPGYTAYGYHFYGQQEDEERLTTPDGGVSGFFSSNSQRIVFLYQPDTLAVTFDANFAGWSPANVTPGSKDVLYDSPYGTLATATRPGYTFAGWFPEGDGNGAVTGTEVTATSIVSVLSNHTLYAKWTEKSNYTVNYDLNGGLYSGSDAVASKTSVSWTDANLLPGGSGYNAASMTKSGYKFVGWNVSVNGSKQGVVSADAFKDLVIDDSNAFITLQAQWVPETEYTVIYYTNGAESPTAIPNDTFVDSSEDPTDHQVVFPAATRAGYVFSGWKVVNKGDGTSDGTLYPAESTNQVFADLAAESAVFIALEAQWTAKEYTVEYNANDDVLSLEAAKSTPETWTPKTDVLWSQNGLVPPAGGNPTREHYAFMGWNTKADGSGMTIYTGTSYSQIAASVTEGESAPDNTMSVTLYAQWEAERSYFVRYDTNGGNPASIPDRQGTYLNTDGLLPEQPTPPTGYAWGGWSVIYNGSKSGVTATDTFGNLATDPNLGYIVLQAQYSPIGGLTVSYDLNYSPLPVPDPTPAAKTGVVWTQTHLLPNADPTRSGWTFVGWNTVQDGSGTFITSADNFGVLAGGDDSRDEVTLYAQWVEAGKYTIQYDLNGGTQPSTPIENITLVDDADADGTAGKLYGYQKPIPAPTPVPPAGYEFVGWSLADNGHGLGNTSKSPDGTKAYDEFAYYDVDTASYAGTMKMRANYEMKENYSVYFDWNYPGALYTGATAEAVSGVVWTDAGFVPHAASRSGGWNLLGWTTDAEGTSAYALPASTYSMLAGGVDMESVTLYAQWQESSYFVRYDLNGGQAPSSAPADSYEDYRVGFYDNNLLANAPTPERSGYKFTGWDVSDNGSGQNVTNAERYSDLANTGAQYIVLQAQWSKTYIVRFDTNEADSPASIPNYEPADGSGVTYWTEVELPGGPERMGYNFAGWKVSQYGSTLKTAAEIAASSAVSDNTQYGQLDKAITQDTGSITLQAQWQVKTGYAVTYVLNGGAAAPENEADFHSKTNLDWTDNVNPASTPVRTGWSFSGWKVTSGGSEAVIVDNTPYGALATDDTVMAIELTAQWTARNYTVNYELGNAEASVNPSTPGFYNPVTDVLWEGTGLIPTNTNIDNEHYVFQGWKVTKCGQGAEDGPVYLPGTDNPAYSVLAGGNDAFTEVTLTAQWIPKTYTVTFVHNNGSSNTTQKVSYKDTATRPSPDPSYGANTFCGWALDGVPLTPPESGVEDSNAYDFNTLITDDITLYANWNPPSYLLYFDPDGGTFSGEEEGDGIEKGPLNATLEDPEVTLTTDDFPAQELTKPGYVLEDDGWYTAKSGGTKVEAGTAITELQTLYPHWEPIVYDIIYDLDHGTNAEDNPISYTVEDGFLRIGNPTRNGYAFLGWTATGGVEIDENTTDLLIPVEKMGAITLTAHWDLTEYNVSYEGIAGAADPDPMPESYTVEDDTFPIFVGDISKPGYTFNGWKVFYANEDIADITTPVKNYSVPEGTWGNITLIADWTPNQYTIGYHGLDGASDPDFKPESYTVESGFPLLVGTPAKEGYTFIGWTVHYANSSFADITTPVERYSVPEGTIGDIILTAHWQEKSDVLNDTPTPSTGELDRLPLGLALLSMGLFATVGIAVYKKRTAMK